MTQKTVSIGDVDITIRKDGDARVISATNRKTGASGEPLSMTKEQCSTLADVLKIMAS